MHRPQLLGLLSFLTGAFIERWRPAAPLVLDTHCRCDCECPTPAAAEAGYWVLLGVLLGILFPWALRGAWIHWRARGAAPASAARAALPAGPRLAAAEVSGSPRRRFVPVGNW